VAQRVSTVSDGVQDVVIEWHRLLRSQVVDFRTGFRSTFRTLSCGAIQIVHDTILVYFRFLVPHMAFGDTFVTPLESVTYYCNGPCCQ